VTVQFTVAGQVSDYDTAKQSAITAPIASAAGVDVSAVTLTLTPASVLIVAEIIVLDGTTAIATAAALATGIFSSAAALQQALGTTATVEEISSAPIGSGGSGGSSSSSNLGVIVGASVGGFVAVVICAGLAYYLAKKNANKSTPKSTVSTASATSSASSSAASSASTTAE